MEHIDGPRCVLGKNAIMFIAAHGDVNTCSVLAEAGAKACLFKPLADTALLAALNSSSGSELTGPFRRCTTGGMKYKSLASTSVGTLR
jgi:hypothetical protein